MKNEEIIQKFNSLKPLFKQLMDESLFIINKAIEDKNLKIHTIYKRIKDADSFVKKAERKQLVSPFEQITDSVGIRIVCLFRSDIDIIGKIIVEEFDVLSVDNKIDDAEVSSFGYMSSHYIVKIKSSNSGPRYDAIKNYPFEIQVRTIAMDAWATISHYLDYKNQNDVPSELKKDFYALSGLFYVADTHFKIFYDSSIRSKENLKKEIEEIKEKGKELIPLNADSLNVYLRSRFSERPKDESKYISELVSELKMFGYETIQSIEEFISSAKIKFLEEERKHLAKNRKYFYNPVGVIRTSLRLINPEYNKYWQEKRKKLIKKFSLEKKK